MSEELKSTNNPNLSIVLIPTSQIDEFNYSFNLAEFCALTANVALTNLKYPDGQLDIYVNGAVVVSLTEPIGANYVIFNRDVNVTFKLHMANDLKNVTPKLSFDVYTPICKAPFKPITITLS
jgi:hypothetical protein